MDNKDNPEGSTPTITKSESLLKPASGGNLQGPPGKPTAVGAPEDPNRPLTGYDRKRAVRAAAEIMNLPPQTRGKK